MKDQRRYELGKMFLDITKYLATVGLIGSIVGGKMSLISILGMIVVILISGLVGFLTIPKEKRRGVR
jgi:hypothetical protein